MLPLLLTLAAPAEIDLYIGTYTSNEGSKGIYRARLDSATGAISNPELVAEAPNPSYLAWQGDQLYAVHETDEGGASSYRVEKDGALSRLSLRGGLGSAPCHVAFDPKSKSLLSANYGAGSLVRIPVEKDGSLGEGMQTFQNAGSSANKSRQEGPHAHAVVIHPHSGLLYACDLGTDEILVSRIGSKGFELVDRTKTRPGSGPRHLAFGKDGRFAYVNNELDNTVVAYAVDGTGLLTAVQTLTTLPEGFKGQSHTAEIAVHPNGRWVYVSNRGHDSLSVYGIGEDGTLSPVEIKTTGVREPRGFAIDPTGHWLVVGGQNSDDVFSLPLDPKTGELGDAKGKARLSKPVCIVFRP